MGWWPRGASGTLDIILGAYEHGLADASAPRKLGIGPFARMKFFIDTADVPTIRELAATGLVDGVTTNPSLVAKSGRKFLEVVREICDIVPGHVSAEVPATDHDTMRPEARTLAKLPNNRSLQAPTPP